jgi:hypothetical protein
VLTAVEELEVVASSGVVKARVWTEARKKLSGVKMVECILMLIVPFLAGCFGISGEDSSEMHCFEDMMMRSCCAEDTSCRGTTQLLYIYLTSYI